MSLRTLTINISPDLNDKMKKLDTVFIRGLTVDTIIGCHDWEKQKTQVVRFDIEMAWDLRNAGKSDRLGDTLDYSAVAERINEYCQSFQFELVEALADSVATLIMTEFSVPGLRLRVAKPEVMGNTIDVGVQISRGVDF